MTIQDDDHALPRVVADEAITGTDVTLFRVETVMSLLLRASISAASIRGATTSEHDRLQAAMLASALDEALAEQRILWLELAVTVVATGVDGPHRYRDVSTGHDERQRSADGLGARSKR